MPLDSIVYELRAGATCSAVVVVGANVDLLIAAGMGTVEVEVCFAEDEVLVMYDEVDTTKDGVCLARATVDVAEAANLPLQSSRTAEVEVAVVNLLGS